MKTASSSYEILEWDSHFFGYGVARLVSGSLPADALRIALDHLATQGIRLVYWTVSSSDAAANESARYVHGLHVDEKITFCKPLSTLEGYTVDADIHPFAGQTPNAALCALAVQSSEYSRFRMDTRIGAGQCDDLYTQWITNSVSGKIATDVLVYYRVCQPVGMVTLHVKNGVGDIGLLSVDRQFRGQKIGTRLMEAADYAFRQKKISQVHVVTQAANRPACAFYQSCGFDVASIENVYHFWLQKRPAPAGRLV